MLDVQTFLVLKRSGHSVLLMSTKYSVLAREKQRAHLLHNNKILTICITTRTHFHIFFVCLL